ncbi:MAG: hypothetical protein SFX73_26535 [Kofleriaceae bacterium]|nr:hypothetical protein [Kofleriaceae bacterium]
MLTRSLVLPVVLVGCSGGARQVDIGPPPAARTSGTLTGPLCEYDRCTCRSENGDVGEPEGARKRFEIRLVSAQPLWMSLPGDTVLYKDAEKVEACFYVDLAPGAHPIALRASNKDGVSAEVFVRELGTKTKSWYETFHFECGHPGVCSFEELAGIKSEYAQYKRGLHDPCGSVKIKNIAWDHGKAPDGTHPAELEVHATLDVYKFAPWKAHGDPTCGEGGGRAPDASNEAAPESEPAATP